MRMSQSRRRWLARCASAGIGLSVGWRSDRHTPVASDALFVGQSKGAPDNERPTTRSSASRQHPRAIIEDLVRRAFDWFQKHQHPATGLVLDRGLNQAAAPLRFDLPAMASLSACGFYLSLLPAWVSRDWLSRESAERAATTLLGTAIGQVEHHHGVLYHFVDWRNGRRWRTSEVATLDTAIFLNGAMVAAAAFGDKTAVLANSLLDRVGWPEFVIDGPRAKQQLLAMGWSPERGFYGPADVRTSEMAMAYFVAAGSSRAIDPQLWRNTRIDRGVVATIELLHPTFPLFTSNYGLGWHDLRGLVDSDGVDLDADARAAALANRAYCHMLAARRSTFVASNGDWWGLSAGDSPRGYVAVGPAKDDDKNVSSDVDGTVWPLAALATLPWIADEMLDDLERWFESPLWKQSLGDFGLAPIQVTAAATWIGTDLIGIDLGSFAVGVENERSDGVRRHWMRHEVGQRAIARLGYGPSRGETK